MGDLAYDDIGRGEPLVFLHGITGNRHLWGPVVERLADRYRCVTVDLVAHGDSPRSGPADLFGQVGAITGLLAELELERPVLVGHSFGGIIATFTATAHPVRGVVNVDQAFDFGAFAEALGPLEPLLRGDDFDATFAQVLEGFGLDLIPAERQQLARANHRPDQDVVLEIWATVWDTPTEELAGQVEGALGAVGAPYLGVFGAPLSEEEQRLQALIPQSTVEVWDGHGHYLHLVDPDRAAARIHAFVSTLH